MFPNLRECTLGSRLGEFLAARGTRVHSELNLVVQALASRSRNGLDELRFDDDLVLRAHAKDPSLC